MPLWHLQAPVVLSTGECGVVLGLSPTLASQGSFYSQLTTGSVLTGLPESNLA